MTIGIRHEDKYVMERRVPLIPRHIRRLIDQDGLRVLVQTSPKRIFKDDEFKSAGAEIVDDLADARVIFGVKEMPVSFFEKNKTYIFFSHVIKGQPYNMPMLKKMMDMGCNLIDYERIADSQGRRLIFFGRYAGLAGMINSLWSLGQRLKVKGILTPFLDIKQAHQYDSLEEAKEVISKVGHKIAGEGLPPEIRPLTIGFTGYGNVSAGAQEIAGLLPIKEISPGELKGLSQQDNLPANVLYKIVFKEWDLSRPKDPSVEFELSDYYTNPGNYEDQFGQYLPHLSVLMNCMYWDERYPRIVTKNTLKEMFAGGDPKLAVIGDITCDPDGSIECTHKGTEIEDPVFVYDPFTDSYQMGFEGRGILDMAVDILPSELPRESSIAFSDALIGFVKDIAATDFSKSFGELSLPAPVKKALILHQGVLAPDYAYLQEHL